MPSTFALSLAKFAKKAGENADLVVAKVVLDIGTRLVELSPVGNPELWASNANSTQKRSEHGGKWPKAQIDRAYPVRAAKGYIGGHFRANWQYGNFSGAGIPVNELNTSDAENASAATAINNMLAKLPQQGAAGMVHVIMNNTPYAKRLEDGWSQQAPTGMVNIVLREYQNIVQGAAGVLNNAAGAQVFRSER